MDSVPISISRLREVTFYDREGPMFRYYPSEKNFVTKI